MESRNLGVTGDLPYAVGILGHGIQFAQIQLHGLGIGCHYLESCAEVGVDHRVLLAVEIGRGRGGFRELSERNAREGEQRKSDEYYLFHKAFLFEEFLSILIEAAAPGEPLVGRER